MIDYVLCYNKETEINTEMEKAYDNDKYMSMIVNVDTISTESKDLIAETKVRVYFHPVV